LISDIKTKTGNAYHENNIYCTFDLSKSVSHFQEKVTKILELTNIPEWNGQTFKLREKEIRESALI
jgi:hypothetical protein